MDDFESGPQSFLLYLNSTNDIATKNSVGFTTFLTKPLNFSEGTWKVGLKQLIFKQVFPTLGTMSYVTPKAKDKFHLTQPTDDTFINLLIAINKSIPNAIKGTTFAIDRNGKLYLRITNAQIKIDSPFLAKFLGFKVNTFYPDSLQDQELFIYGTEPMFLDSVFKVTADFITPQTDGSQVLVMDSVPNNLQVLSYEYNNPDYIPVFGSYFTSINIKILDIFGKNFTNIDENFPIVLKLHFQKDGIF